MSDAEIRRRRLLQETRERYNDTYNIPAVHPRYHAAYRNIYGEEKYSKSTFGFRLLLCLVLFAMFITIDTEQQKIWNVDSKQVKGYIESTWFLR